MGQVVSQFIADYGELLAEGVRDTIIMTAVATLLAYVIGLPIGVLLITSAKKGIRPNAPLNTVLGWIVNIVRSVPFIILLVAIIPLTRLIVGTSLGVPGAIVPLVITAAPFVARVVEQSLAEVAASRASAAPRNPICWRFPTPPRSGAALAAGVQRGGAHVLRPAHARRHAVRGDPRQVLARVVGQGAGHGVRVQRRPRGGVLLL